MKNYYIRLISNKPKEDINEIVDRLGWLNIAPRWTANNGIAHFMTKFATLFCILWKMRRGDRLLIQYPMKKFVTPTVLCAHLKGARVVVLIHDLGCFRRKKLTVKHEMRRMNRVDEIIAHNPSMKAFMQQNGCTTPIRCLGIFDYLSSAEPARYDVPHKPWRVAYAGGLGYSRNPFLYSLDAHMEGWEMDLFGKSFEPEWATDWKHMHFKGLLPPDTLIATVEADFGLVWDGNSLDECSGDWGEYLLFNNPHKTSFYLRAGIPVILWDKAALAPFILEHQAGIVCHSLRDIDRLLQELTPERYAAIRQSAQQLGRQIAAGHFTQAALNAC